MAMIHEFIPWRDREDEASLRNMSRLQRDIDSILDDFLRIRTPVRAVDKTAVIAPRMDVAESMGAYHLSLELPGISEKDVEIEMHEGVLTIRGEKKAEEKKEGKSWHRVERTYGSFQRSISLPQGIDEEGVTATFRNGILEIDVLKSAKKQEKNRKIAIKTT